ncbi:response regulator transcription factor [Denitromonas iodatirespirans]|uniref:Response regulator n=1 Tax=Denitromonas iodatirespirans TaxID=2795389 RepID=A0A944D6K7_DENI1|nr:response regulator [Denitromonas iodatirespirans]MBT0960945.1 response regulator [Denitromonas iodatirespirans]
MTTSGIRTVLVVDDDPAFNRILCRTLSHRGLECIGALDGSMALQEMRRVRPDAVILDLNLAGSSGLPLIAPLREVRADTRILVLTGYASITTAVDAIKLGAHQYLAKPADADSILRALTDAVTAPCDTAPVEPMSVDRLEWEHIQRVLAEHQGNISATARALKMHRRTLQRKLAKRPVKE